MRTRAQKRDHMEEIAEQLQLRIHALEAKSFLRPVNNTLSSQKKRKIDVVSTSSLPLSPPLHEPPTPMLTAFNSTTIGTTIKISPNDRTAMRRTLNCTKQIKSNLIDAPQGILQRICSGQLLHNRLPIVERFKEQKIIRDVLKSHIAQCTSVFLVGPPGTGKSSSVEEVLTEQGFISIELAKPMKQNRASECVKIAVKINCSTFTDPAVLYAKVAQGLNATTCWQVPSHLDPLEIDNFLAGPCHGGKSTSHVIAVVLDEVDHLLHLPKRMQSSIQAMIHFFVRWAAIDPHTLKFVSIMNGIDLYEQVARMHASGTTTAHVPVPRVVFSSYTHQQLQHILQRYVQHACTKEAIVFECMEPRAIECIARKVAARDGDARLAISLLQQSARHALQRCSRVETKANTYLKNAKILMRDVLHCATTMLSSPIVLQIKQLPRQAKILLYVITTLAPGSDANEQSHASCDLNQVSEELARLRRQPPTAWIPCLSREELQRHLMSLDCFALIKQHQLAMSVRTIWTQQIKSCVAMSNVLRALQDDTSLATLLRQAC